MKLSNCFKIIFAVLLALTMTSAVAKDKNPKPRPFSGVVSGEAQFPMNDNCVGVTGSPWQTLSAAIGDLSHMGNSEYYSAHCSTLDGSALAAGEATIIAANGDELWLTYTGVTQQPPPNIVIDVDYVVVGGTGRFEGASGMIDSSAFVTFEGFDDPSWPVVHTFAGYIIY